MPGRHGPSLIHRLMPPVMGSMVEFYKGTDRVEPLLRLYITGDTIFYEGLREIPERVPEIDLALLHLGGTRVMGVTVTMDADQGLELLRSLKPPLTVPIHYDDYEAFKSPLEDFLTAVAEARARRQGAHGATGRDAGAIVRTAAALDKSNIRSVWCPRKGGAEG